MMVLRGGKTGADSSRLNGMARVERARNRPERNAAASQARRRVHHSPVRWLPANNPSRGPQLPQTGALELAGAELQLRRVLPQEAVQLTLGGVHLPQQARLPGLLRLTALAGGVLLALTLA